MADGMRSVLVTGATGSFGQAFTRRLLSMGVERIVILSRGEHKQAEMAEAFAAHADRLRFFVGDVRDRDRLEVAMRDVDTVIHAAALKSVPACEYNPQEAVATNVMGTLNVVLAAMRCGVSKAMFISTDKATAASTLYGATKFTAERTFISANALGGGRTKFSCVRYGNVIGSNGSVVLLFKRLVAEGTDSLPITDVRMTRFLWPIEEAVEFTRSSIDMMQGGEVFVPKLTARRIVDVAREIAPQLPHRITGIRPGEKLHELLISEDESRSVFDIGDRYVIQSGEPPTHGIPVGEGFVLSSEKTVDAPH